MSILFIGANNGDIADVTQYDANWNLVDASFGDLGPTIVSGLVPSIGAGLAVSVTAGVASIGGHVAPAASFNIAGLMPSTTNHLYLLQNGTGTANPTGTAPANSVKLGTCVTGVGTVTSVSTNWASGRQQQVRTENLVHGAGAGQPRSLNLASWAASGNEGQECVGTLPAGAVPASFSGDVTLTPNSVNRNLVQPTADANHGLVLRGFSPTQSGTLLDVQQSTGTTVAFMDATGLLFTKTQLVGTNTAAFYPAALMALFGSPVPMAVVGTAGGADCHMIGPVDAGKAWFIDFIWDVYNAAAPAPVKQIFAFGADGVYSDAGVVSAAEFYLTDIVNGLNVLDYQVSPKALTVGATGMSLGVLGKTPQARQTLPANATDLATAITLVNAIKSQICQGFGFAA